MRRSLLLISCVLSAAASAGELESLLKGPLTQETLKDVIHEHHAEVRRCASERPADRQAVEGKVVVHFVIGLDGKLGDVKVASSTLSEPKLEGCLLGAVKQWRFPKPKHGKVEVNFPFKVGPPGKPPRARPPAEDKEPTGEDAELLK